MQNKILSTAIGRRKTSTASVRVLSGKGELTINGKPISQYFPGKFAESHYILPFKTTSVLDKYSASVKVSGGGPSSQLDATILGLSRALVKIKDEHKSPLRQAGLLTRDSRKRQHRMPGTGGKARRQKQSPKR